jgi:hypothetical protein
VRRFTTALIVVVLALPAHAGELQRVAKAAVHDVQSLAAAPLHWKAPQWERFGEGAALVLAVGAADKPIEDFFQRNRNGATNSFAKTITPWGAHRALEVSAVMIGVGYLSHRPNLFGAGVDSLEAQFWAAGIITPIVKRLAGRSRPNAELGTYNFRPFRSDSQSFPSGHATNAFAAATAIAGHYDTWVVPTIVYTVATGVAMSRLHDHVHWPSDVVAGALIGRAVAKGIVFRHRHLEVTPIVGPHEAGLMFDLDLKQLRQ